MKTHQTYLTVTPVRKSTGATAPKIVTNVLKTKNPTQVDIKSAIKEAKERSKLSDFPDDWNFKVNAVTM